MVELLVRPAHDGVIHPVLDLEHDGRYVVELLHGTGEESMGEEGVVIALDCWGELFVVASQKGSSSFEERDPTTDL